MKKRWLGLAFVLCILIPVVAMATLSYGSTGEDVTALQERLEQLGYYSFRITGNYQENTQKAVSTFQEAHGLPVTGQADEQLQYLLFSADAMPKPTQAPIAFPGKLQYGNGGENVQRIQARLAALGYYHDVVSGNYLDNTRNAVRDFQRQNALVVDGVVGQETWQWLFFESEPVDAAATPRPTPEPTPVPYRIGIDLTNQVTTIYGRDAEGGYSEVIKHMICSTGKDSDPTPPGTYTLNGKTARWCYFPKWGTHAQYWTRIDAYNAFHSVIYSEANAMALKTDSYTGLGKPASHGCIRLMVEDAKWIYDNCGAGTEVIIHEAPLDEELTKSLKIPPLDYNVMLPQPTPAATMAPIYQSNALPPMPFSTLERGSEGEAVYWLQCKLAEMGYYQGSITGGYYAGTVEAVKAFQRDHGLSVDGKAGKDTQNVLYAAALATPAPVSNSILSAGQTIAPLQVEDVATPQPLTTPVFYVPRDVR